MTLRTMLAAAATMTVAAASGAVWYSSAPQGGAPVSAPSSQPAAAPAPPSAGRDVVVVCIAGDQIVHAPVSQDNCAAGQRKVELDPEKEECPMCPPSDEPTPDDRSDNEALNDLDRRMDALENAPYFEVVNDDEQPVFRVAPDGVSIFNKAGLVMAKFGTSQSGGYFTARSASASLEATMTATGASSGFRIREDGLVRLTLNSREGGGSSYRVVSAKGIIAGLGESVDGPGTLLLGALDGQVKATISVPNGRGMFHVEKDSNNDGLSLMEQSNGGGMFQLDTAKGAAIKMGNVSNRYGIVMAGPTLGLALVPKSGLPGSFFLGCGSQAPPACVPLVP